MAEKRMFSQKITKSDAFLDLPTSSQALYFHLNMDADDEGFVSNPKTIQRLVRASDDDYKLLLVKNFIIGFDNGVVVIKHWWMHNAIRQDRIKETAYTEQKALLDIKDNMSYTMTDKCPTSVSVDNTNLISTKSILITNELNLVIKHIVDYLNNKLGTHYRYNGYKIVSLIKARLNDGFQVEDFEKVIDTKYNEWSSDDKMNKFLRPETLFSNKFESYLNQKQDHNKEINKIMYDEFKKTGKLF
jgi:uncharacterized phage protein (TIGR02220 family)